MYCIQCGVHLADTEKKCPLCNTVVYHPDIEQGKARELYPVGKMPKPGAGRAFFCGAILILFMIPLILTFFSDLLLDGALDWFGYVAGGLVLVYLIFALPVWFKKPNPVIFVPCDFAACAVDLFLVNLLSGGDWFFSFALPVVAGLALITCTPVTLLRYVRRGKLFVVGGVIMAVGAWVLMIEQLLVATFSLPFIGWSVYPLISLALIGGLLIYLALNSDARERVERKLFF